MQRIRRSTSKLRFREPKNRSAHLKFRMKQEQVIDSSQAREIDPYNKKNTKKRRVIDDGDDTVRKSDLRDRYLKFYEKKSAKFKANLKIVHDKANIAKYKKDVTIYYAMNAQSVKGEFLSKDE